MIRSLIRLKVLSELLATVNTHHIAISHNSKTGAKHDGPTVTRNVSEWMSENSCSLIIECTPRDAIDEINDPSFPHKRSKKAIFGVTGSLERQGGWKPMKWWRWFLPNKEYSMAAVAFVKSGRFVWYCRRRFSRMLKLA